MGGFGGCGERDFFAELVGLSGSRGIGGGRGDGDGDGGGSWWAGGHAWIVMYELLLDASEWTLRVSGEEIQRLEIGARDVCWVVCAQA